jgi:hypothetical protein
MKIQRYKITYSHYLHTLVDYKLTVFFQHYSTEGFVLTNYISAVNEEKIEKSRENGSDENLNVFSHRKSGSGSNRKVFETIPETTREHFKTINALVTPPSGKFNVFFQIQRYKKYKPSLCFS